MWNDNSFEVKRVICLVIFFHSAKIRKKVGRTEVLARRSLEESEFLDSLVSFVLKESGLCCEVPSPRPDTNFVYSGDDPLFSRGHWRGARYIQAKLLRVQAAEGVKCAAAIVGIDPKQVSTRSWRKGSITTLVSHGQSDEVARRFGDHAYLNSIIFIIYLLLIYLRKSIVVLRHFYTSLRQDKRPGRNCLLPRRVVFQ